MKCFFLMLFTLSTITVINAQECDYAFKTGTFAYFPKDFELSEENRDKSIENTNRMKSCLSITHDTAELYWLNSTIANKMIMFERLDSVSKYSIAAFELDEVTQCREYISHHISSVIQDSSFFQKHFLDTTTYAPLVEIRTFCQENYLEAALEKIKMEKLEKAKQSSMNSINQTYLNDLVNISINDQKERKKKDLNWEIQNRLDTQNRRSLDSLYSLYGFPSKEKVTDDGLMNAFFVLHHSTDCQWNEIWTRRFLEHLDTFDSKEMLSFYFFRNFNAEDGSCLDNISFFESLKEEYTSEEAQDLFDFTQWYKRLKR